MNGVDNTKGVGMANIETKKTPAELQLNEGQMESYQEADLSDQSTRKMASCPHWCAAGDHTDEEQDSILHSRTIQVTEYISVDISQVEGIAGEDIIFLQQPLRRDMTTSDARLAADALWQAADIAEGVQPTAGLTVQSDENALHVTLPDWLTPEQRHELELSIEVFMAAAVDVLRSRGSES